MSTKTEKKSANVSNDEGLEPIGGKVPLATPPPERQGEGWVQTGTTNINKDPDDVTFDNADKA